MEIIYYFVKHSKAWTLDYHENFFNANAGFIWGLVGALIIGIIVAVAFYFGCCNSKKTSKYATISVWAIFLVVASAIGYSYADFTVIGMAKADNSTTAIFRDYSFYKANDKYYMDQAKSHSEDESYLNDLKQKQLKIKNDLDHYKDVRFSFDITTAILTALFFFLTSIAVKRLTINGRTIPLLKP